VDVQRLLWIPKLIVTIPDLPGPVEGQLEFFRCALPLSFEPAWSKNGHPRDQSSLLTGETAKLQKDERVERMKPTELVVLSTFRSVTDAQIAKGILDAVEIESTIRSDNAGGMYPALDAADLLVRAADAERAREALGCRPRR
jgi:hypothetical protein